MAINKLMGEPLARSTEYHCFYFAKGSAHSQRTSPFRGRMFGNAGNVALAAVSLISEKTGNDGNRNAESLLFNELAFRHYQ